MVPSLLMRPCMQCSCLRGVAHHSKLVNDLWSSAETTRRISQVAQVELKPVYDYEKGHCNVQASTPAPFPSV